jgi:hypothetical protein
MPNEMQIYRRLFAVASTVARNLKSGRRVVPTLDGDHDIYFEGSWAVVGSTASGVSLIIFAGKYFRDNEGRKSVQFWAGLEAPPNKEGLLTDHVAGLADTSFETIGLEAYPDRFHLWLPTEQSKRWYRPHLDLSDRRYYLWFGRFFSGHTDDAVLQKSISRFLLELLDSEKSPRTTRRGRPRNGARNTERFTKVRIGQDRFREDLLHVWDGKCGVKKLDIQEILRASHIKPWAACSTDDERGDPDNGLLLSAELDALFDRGLIGFDAHGKIRISLRLSKDLQRRLGISGSSKLWLRPSMQQAKYLKWHLDYWKL